MMENLANQNKIKNDEMNNKININFSAEIKDLQRTTQTVVEHLEKNVDNKHIH